MTASTPSRPRRRASRRTQAWTAAGPSRVSLAEMLAMGAARRRKTPRTSHAAWSPPRNRPDPLQLLRESSRGRIPELIPLRHGRMLRSPFSFFRGAALQMAVDLASTPSSGLRVQACGDCHLLNFGCFATPERRVILDINDFDETFPGPWEWDVKRLATSFVLSCRENGFRKQDTRAIAVACVRSYRERMAELSQMGTLDVWYASVDVEKHLPEIRDPETRDRFRKRLAQARRRSVEDHHLPEVVAKTRATPTIREDPPLVYHWRGDDRDEHVTRVREAFTAYLETIPTHLRELLTRFTIADVAVKVVGVGSVGTECYVMLLVGDTEDPLFLQIKQARPSVLEGRLGKSPYRSDGERVVIGCQIMQASSDMFLGWAKLRSGPAYYFRQLRDMKIRPLVEMFPPSVMAGFAQVCGVVLAQSHARSGQPAPISGYLGRSDKFDDAIGRFALAYASQVEKDYETLQRAVRAGRLEVVTED
jgi:uncharacterized protein (DUF2252 family)